MNKVVWITGASRGIGRSTALAFAEAGFDVALSARPRPQGEAPAGLLKGADGLPLAGTLEETAEAIQALGRRVLIAPLDLLDSASLGQAYAEVLAFFGRIDVLINNAAYQAPEINQEFQSIDAAGLARMAQAYINSPLQLTQLVLNSMLKQGGGVVINVTSGAGEVSPRLPASEGGWGYLYAAGKAAMARMPGILNAEFGSRGINAYSLNPGVVDTEALRATIGNAGALALSEGIAGPEVPAAVMLWLATDPQALEHRWRTINSQRLGSELKLLGFGQRNHGADF